MEQSTILSDILYKLSIQSHNVYFIFDPQSNQFDFLNAAFSKVWGFSPGQLSTGLHVLLNSVHPDDREHVADSYHQLINGENKQEIEFRITTSSEAVKWIFVSVYRIEGEANKVFFSGTAEDISGKKQYIDNMLKFGAKKNSVLEILSHDLAGPLSILQSLAGVLASKVKPYENQEVNQMIELMIDSCKRNVKLIREFVANEFLESSEVVLKKQRINIVERFKQVIEEYKNAENAIAKTFLFHYSNEPIFIDIDDVKFMQIINNLVSNAIKFTPDDGEISLRIEEKENTVLFVVSDNGIGIPADLQPVLFDKFSKARRNGLRGEESTGLGMSIIKNLVNWHGGKIWFESAENKGSTFYIELSKE